MAGKTFSIILATVMLIVLLFSTAGIYTLTAFTVAQRRREIGVRSALGAQPRRLVTGIFRRALVPVAGGAIVGSLVAVLIDFYLPIDEVVGQNVPGVIPASAALMVVIGLLAASGPARRALRIDPAAALRDDG
jgi:ABC-type antimicrobial peptide transport system permease subunit